METSHNRRMQTIKTQSYTYGTAARKLSTVPAARPERETQRRQTPVRKEKKATMTFQYVAFLAAATLVTLVLCVGYLQLRAEVDGRIKNIGVMELELKDAKTENDANYNYVMKSVDLEEIRKTAIEELGMTYATKDQVVLYESEESDYVRQYEEIPEEKSGTWRD